MIIFYNAFKYSIGLVFLILVSLILGFCSLVMLTLTNDQEDTTWKEIKEMWKPIRRAK
jgi:hypothetical protein